MSDKAKVDIFYQKTNGFRNIYISGVHGGAASNKNIIFMNVFMDRVAIPQQVNVEVNAEGISSGEVLVEGKNGVIREVESCLIFDLETAIAIRGWIDDKIKALQTPGVK